MSADTQEQGTPGAHTGPPGPAADPKATRPGPAYCEDGEGRAVAAGVAAHRGSSTGRLERSLRRAIAARPSDRLAAVGLLVGPGLPDRYAPAVTATVNALVAIAARCAAARRVDVVVGLRGNELLIHAQYDGVRPGENPALDLQAALLRSVQRRAEDCGGGVEMRRVGGRTVIRVTVPAH